MKKFGTPIGAAPGSEKLADGLLLVGAPLEFVSGVMTGAGVLLCVVVWWLGAGAGLGVGRGLAGAGATGAGALGFGFGAAVGFGFGLGVGFGFGGDGNSVE